MVAALAVRFLTSRNTEALEVQKIEADNESRHLNSTYDQVFEARREAEGRLRLFQHDRAELEQYLEGAEGELKEIIKRNEELEGD